MTDKRKEYEEKCDAQLKESSTDANLFNLNRGSAKVEAKVEYYKKIQTLRRTGRLESE